MNNELVKSETFDLAKPQQALTFANTLKEFVVQQNLTSTIDGKQYANVEAWQFAGSQFALFPIMTECKNESTYEERIYKWTDRRNNPREHKTNHFKYRATVEIRRLDNNQIVSRGQMCCTNDERIKHTFDEYAIESMAQTRAEGKAWRMLIGWMMKAAGFEQTPAEEVEDIKDAFDNCPSPEEKKMLIGLAYSAKWSEDKYIDDEKRIEALATISGCADYDLFNRIEARLRDLQPSIHEIVNPSQKDINSHLKKSVK